MECQSEIVARACDEQMAMYVHLEIRRIARTRGISRFQAMDLISPDRKRWGLRGWMKGLVIPAAPYVEYFLDRSLLTDDERERMYDALARDLMRARLRATLVQSVTEFRWL